MNSYPCPRCGKEPERWFPSFFFEFSWTRFDTTFFICHNCRVIYMDRALIREHVKTFKKLQSPSIRTIYKKVIEEMEKILLSLQNQRQYRFIRKYKKPPN